MTGIEIRVFAVELALRNMEREGSVRRAVTEVVEDARAIEAYLLGGTTP